VRSLFVLFALLSQSFLSEFFFEPIFFLLDVLSLPVEFVLANFIESTVVIFLANIADSSLRDVGHTTIAISMRHAADWPDTNVSVRVKSVVASTVESVDCVCGFDELLPGIILLTVIIELFGNDFVHAHKLNQHVLVVLTEHIVFSHLSKLVPNACAPGLNLVIHDVDFLKTKFQLSQSSTSFVDSMLHLFSVIRISFNL
jgi:hypothetical protein